MDTPHDKPDTTTHDAARQVKGTDFRDIDWATGKPIEGQDIYQRRLKSARHDFVEQQQRLTDEATEISARQAHLDRAIAQIDYELKRIEDKTMIDIMLSREELICSPDKHEWHGQGNKTKCAHCGTNKENA